MSDIGFFSNKAIFNLLSELSKTKSLLSNIINGMTEFYLLLDREKNIQATNPYTHSLLGYKKYELINYSYDLIFTRENYEKIRESIDSLLEEEKSGIDFEAIVRTKEGKEIPLLLSVSKIWDKYNETESIILIGKEISERKRAEELLRNAEKDWRDSFNSLEDVMLIIDRDYNIENINEIGLKLLGKSKEEVIGKKCYQVISGADSPSEGCPCMKSLETKKVESLDWYEERFEKYFSIKSSPIFDDNGEIIKFVDLRRDITERKQAEKKLEKYSKNLENMVQERTKELRRALYDTEESRDKIDGILKSIGDGLIVTDTYNRIILMNRAAEDLLGVRFSEVIDRPIDVAIKDETLRHRFKTSLEEREPGYQFDFELPGENSKHPRIIRARTSEIKDKAGNQTGIITIIYDVTLEREVDRMKTEFLSAASHQLRTPLTSILGFSEILMTRDNIKEKQKKEFISYINTQSVNLANIINDLLDISRIESGIGFTLHKVFCNINEIIRETVKHFQASHPKRQFDIILPKEPLELMVDKDKIGQVLENILSNAVKYSHEGGSICLTAKMIADCGLRILEYPIADCRLQNADLKDEKYAAIEISVADQGMGMSPDQVEKIFDKFYRANASDSAILGTGLGMSIVKNYVEAHGGKVRVESELGKGTVVKFVLQI